MSPVPKQIVVYFALGLAILLTGCKAPPTVELKTIADAEARFAPPAQLSIAVLKLRGCDDADAPHRPEVIARDALGLEGRQFVTAIERGLREAGFTIATPEQADLLAFCARAIITGEYDAYRRVPAHESIRGTIHTRRGFHTYYESATSEVLIPERRRFVDQVVQISIHRNDPDQDAVQFAPDGSTELWIGRIRGRKSMVEEDLDAIVGELLRDWGRTEHRWYELPHK